MKKLTALNQKSFYLAIFYIVYLVGCHILIVLSWEAVTNAYGFYVKLTIEFTAWEWANNPVKIYILSFLR